MVGAIGFEPTTFWSQTRRSTKLSYTPKIGESVWSCVLITLREPTAYTRWQYPLLSVKWRGFNVSLNDGKFTAKQAANTIKMTGDAGFEPAAVLR